jgi:hypothetical protein
MEMISKIVRTLASIPVIGGALVFVLGFLPVILVLFLDLSNGLSMIIGGLLMAAWCYFLNAKKIINIVTPLIPIPLWIIGIVMALAGVYGIITNKWDESDAAPEVVNEKVKPSGGYSDRAVKPQKQPEPASNQEREQAPAEVEDSLVEKPLDDRKVELEKLQKKAGDEALVQMEKSLEDMKKLSESLGKEQFEKIINSHGESENVLTLEDLMAKLQKQIDELKSQGYGSGNTE